MKNLVDKIKDILKDLFEPIKNAWDKVYPYLKKAWEYMGKELLALAKSIGSAFLEAWKTPIVEHIFEMLFSIIGDLMMVVGNLAKRFREAWDSITEGGKRLGVEIFENLFTLIDILITHVRNVTKYMVEWSDKLDFKPLLNGINNLLYALRPLADFLGGVFEDVMKNIVLEHIRYLIEDGIPHLCKAIEEVLNAFDFEKLRTQLQPIEETFEKMTQQIHEGLINAMKNLGIELGRWTQTESFQNFLDGIQHFMEQVTAERVEKLFTGLGMGILKIVEALADFIGSPEFKQWTDDFFAWYDSLSSEDIANFFLGIAKGIGQLALGLLKFIFSEPFKNFIKAITDWITNLDSDEIAKFLEGIAKGIEKLAEGVGKFLDSKLFKDFMKSLEDWYKNASADDIANGLVLIANAIIGFKFASFAGGLAANFIGFLAKLAAFKNLSTIAKGLTDVGAGAAAAGKGAAAAGTGTATAAASLGSVAALAAGATADLVLVAADFDNLKDASEGYSDASKAHKEEVRKALDELANLYDKQGPEIAASWAKTCYDIDITGQSLAEAQNSLERQIDEQWDGVPQSMFEGFEQGWNAYFGQDGMGLWQLVQDGFTQLIDKIKEFLGIHSPSTVMEEIGINLVEGLQNGITEIWGDLVTGVGELVSELVTSITEGFTGLAETIGETFVSLKDGAVEKFTEIKDGVVEKTTELKDGAIEKYEELKTAAGEKLALFKEDAVLKATELKDGAVAKYEELKQGVTEKVTALVQGGQQKFNNFKTAAVGAANALKSETVTKYEQLKTEGVKKFEELKKGATDKFNDAKKAVDEKLRSMKESVTNKTKDMADKFKERFNNIKETTAEKFKAANDKIKEKMQEAVKICEDKITKIKNKFEKFNLESTGKNLIRGFLAGVKQMWANVVAWASQALADFKAKFSQILQIHSPSKVFMKYGEYTVLGFNKGLETFSETTGKTVEKWVGSFANMDVSLEPDIKTNLSKVPLVSNSTLQTESNGLTKEQLVEVLNEFGSYITSRRNEPEMKVVLEMDGRQIYEQVVRQDKQQMLRTGRSLLAY